MKSYRFESCRRYNKQNIHLPEQPRDKYTKECEGSSIAKTYTHTDIVTTEID